jgi:O-antigen/teichoic acid export membrane protein
VNATVTTHGEALTDATSARTRPGIAASSKWVLLGTMLSKPLQLATTLMLARILGPAGFGLLGLANVTAVTLSNGVGLGLGDAASKFVAEHFRRDRPKAVAIASLIAWVLVLLGTLCFVGAWFSRAYWAPRVFHERASNALVGLCLLLAFGNLLVSLSTSLFTGLQQFRHLTILTVLQATLTCGFAAVFGWWLGLYGALIASLLSAALCIGWSARKLYAIDAELLRWPDRAARAKLGSVLHFSFPSWLGGFLINPITVFTFSYLASQPRGGEALGAFTSANGLRMLVAILPGLIGSVLGPAIIEEARRHGARQSYERLLDDALAALAVLTLPATTLLILFSDILFLMYGRAYAGSYALFMPMAAGIAIGVLCAPMQFAIVAQNRTWSLLCMSVIKALVLLGLALAWIPDRLGSGLAWASLVAELSFAVMVTEFAAWKGLTPRHTSYVLYGYGAGVLVVLGGALMVPPIWRWIAALPLALAVTVLIIRQYPASAVWIAGAVPQPFRGPVRRGLAVAAGHGV